LLLPSSWTLFGAASAPGGLPRADTVSAARCSHRGRLPDAWPHMYNRSVSRNQCLGPLRASDARDPPLNRTGPGAIGIFLLRGQGLALMAGIVITGTSAAVNFS